MRSTPPLERPGGVALLLATARPAWTFTAFRLACGVAIGIYFAEQLAGSVDLLSTAHPHAGQPMWRGIEVRNAATLVGVAPMALRGLFIAAVAAAALIAAGVLVKPLAASVFVLGVLTRSALISVSDLDDYVVVVAAFWVFLLPGGIRLGLPARSWRDAARRPVGAGFATAFAAFVMVFYVLFGSGLLEAGTPHWQPGRGPVIACCLLPALFVAPGAATRIAGVLLQLTLHGYLAHSTGLVVTHLFFAATAFLVWTPSGTSSAGVPAVAPVTMTAPLLVGVFYTFLVALLHAWPTQVLAPSRASALRLLFDAGLWPAFPELALPASRIRVDVRFPGRGAMRAEPRAARVQLLLSQLAQPRDVPLEPLSIELAKGVLGAYCTPDGAYESGLAIVSMSSAASAEWTFTCTPSGRILSLERAPARGS